jgi:hypothetical protein
MADPAAAPDLLHIAAQYVVPAIVGGAAGVVASVAAPWTNWAVERRRSQMANRREMVGNWRGMLDREHVWRVGPDGRLHLLVDRDYGSLRPFLSPEAIDELEGSQFNVAGVVLQAQLARLHGLLAAEIARIEQRDWRLV